MQFPIEVKLHAIKESAGEYEGKSFSSCTFHCEVDIKENGTGRAMGRVTRPFKLPDATLFDKWLPYSARLAAGPIACVGIFELVPVRDDKTELKLIDLRPAAQPKAA